MMLGSLVLLAGLFWLLLRSPAQNRATTELFFYCAAGVREAVEPIVADYAEQYGVTVQVQYGGSNTLLSQIEVGRVGDLYLAADESYTTLAREKDLVQEIIPVAVMRPVIAVRQGNPGSIQTIDDLLRDDVRVALGNPGQAAVGKLARELLSASGQWEQLAEHASVLKPTVHDVANDIKIGSVDAGIIWDAVVAQYPDLEAIRVPELDPGAARISVGILNSADVPTEALRFARYLTARDRGLIEFTKRGYEVVDGDVWADEPQLVFYAGAVNRRALEPVIEAFSQREGVSVQTVYNGCGILTAQMRSILDQHTSGFPDFYMACDQYYLDEVEELFQDAVQISTTDIVIVVQPGNPQNIETLDDLARPGVRVVLGQPEQCTIGVLSRRLLDDAGLYEKVLAENVKSQTTSSALLIPAITTGAADAVLAYRSDTLAESDKFDVITIDSPLAHAVQPYGIARTSEFKHLGRRLLEAIARSRESFEAAGFAWQLAGPSAPPDDDSPGENAEATDTSPAVPAESNAASRATLGADGT